MCWDPATQDVCCTDTGASQGWTVHATSRNPLNNLAGIPSDQRLRFDLEQPSTWLNIPAQADLIWCFPATPLEQVQAFARTLNAPPRRIVVLGSTSAYEASDHSAEYPPPWIDESAPIDLTKPRVQGEEYLREYHGAIVLRVAGIYGPGRNPLDWIRQGRVGPSRKYVNLIHVEDLAAICLLALEQGKPGETYNVSDGTPYFGVRSAQLRSSDGAWQRHRSKKTAHRENESAPPSFEQS